MTWLFSIFASCLLAMRIISPTDIAYPTLESAFMSGDAAKIVSMGKEKLMVSVLDKEGAYSQSQAIQVLKEFFTKKPATQFKFTFKGKETDEGTFAIGNYQSKGEAFRVTIKWKKAGSDLKIESIVIEKG